VHRDGTPMENADAILTRSNGGMIGEILREQQAGRLVGVPKGTKADLSSLVHSARYLKGGGPADRMHEDLAPFRSWDEVSGRPRRATTRRSRCWCGSSTPMAWASCARSPTTSWSPARATTWPASPSPRCRTAPDRRRQLQGHLENKDYLKKAGFTWAAVPGAPMKKNRRTGKTEPTKAWTVTGTPEQRLAAIAKARDLSTVKPDVVVSTAHKAKGLEWDRVRIGDDFRGPKVDPETDQVWRCRTRRSCGWPTWRSPARRRSSTPGSLAYVFQYTEENGGTPGAGAPNTPGTPGTPDAPAADPLRARLDELAAQAPATPTTPDVPEHDPVAHQEAIEADARAAAEPPLTPEEHQAGDTTTWANAIESATENWTEHNGRQPETDADYAEIQQWARSGIQDSTVGPYEGDNPVAVRRRIETNRRDDLSNRGINPDTGRPLNQEPENNPDLPQPTPDTPSAPDTAGTPGTPEAPADRPSAYDLAAMTRNAPRDAVLDSLDEQQLAALARELYAQQGQVRRNMGNNGWHTRAERLQTAIERRLSTMRAARRPQSERPVFTERNVFDYVNEPGTTFDTGEVAQHFGVPQPRVLAALRRLESDGWIARNSGNDTGDSVSGGRRNMNSLGWETGVGMDGDTAAHLAAYDAQHGTSAENPGAVLDSSSTAPRPPGARKTPAAPTAADLLGMTRTAPVSAALDKMDEGQLRALLDDLRTQESSHSRLSPADRSFFVRADKLREGINARLGEPADSPSTPDIPDTPSVPEAPAVPAREGTTLTRWERSLTNTHGTRSQHFASREQAESAHLGNDGTNRNTPEVYYHDDVHQVDHTYQVGDKVRVYAYGGIREGEVTGLKRGKVTVKFTKNKRGESYERAFGPTEITPRGADDGPATPEVPARKIPRPGESITPDKLVEGDTFTSSDVNVLGRLRAESITTLPDGSRQIDYTSERTGQAGQVTVPADGRVAFQTPSNPSAPGTQRATDQADYRTRQLLRDRNRFQRGSNDSTLLSEDELSVILDDPDATDADRQRATADLVTHAQSRLRNVPDDKLPEVLQRVEASDWSEHQKDAARTVINERLGGAAADNTPTTPSTEPAAEPAADTAEARQVKPRDVQAGHVIQFQDGRGQFLGDKHTVTSVERPGRNEYRIHTTAPDGTEHRAVLNANRRVLLHPAGDDTRGQVAGNRHVADLVAGDKLDGLSTPDLIAQYDQAVSRTGGRPQARINKIVDLLSTRADDEDQAALDWLKIPDTRDTPNTPSTPDAGGLDLSNEATRVIAERMYGPRSSGPFELHGRYAPGQSRSSTMWPTREHAEQYARDRGMIDVQVDDNRVVNARKRKLAFDTIPASDVQAGDRVIRGEGNRQSVVGSVTRTTPGEVDIQFRDEEQPVHLPEGTDVHILRRGTPDAPGTTGTDNDPPSYSEQMSGRPDPMRARLAAVAAQRAAAEQPMPGELPDSFGQETPEAEAARLEQVRQREAEQRHQANRARSAQQASRGHGGRAGMDNRDALTPTPAASSSSPTQPTQEPSRLPPAQRTGTPVLDAGPVRLGGKVQARDTHTDRPDIPAQSWHSGTVDSIRKQEDGSHHIGVKLNDGRMSHHVVDAAGTGSSIRPVQTAAPQDTGRQLGIHVGRDAWTGVGMGISADEDGNQTDLFDTSSPNGTDTPDTPDLFAAPAEGGPDTAAPLTGQPATGEVATAELQAHEAAAAAEIQRQAEEAAQARDAQLIDQGGIPWTLDYDYLSQIEGQPDKIEQLQDQLLRSLESSGDPRAEARWAAFEKWADVNEHLDEITSQAGRAGVSDQEITDQVNAFLDANGVVGLTHPDVGGWPPVKGSSKTVKQLTDEYNQLSYEQYMDAEEATNGYLLNKKGQAKGVSPEALFSGDVRQALAYASEELLAYWETHPRMSFQQYAYQQTGKQLYADAARRHAEANSRISRDRIRANGRSGNARRAR
jgi:hypothetical protein